MNFASDNAAGVAPPIRAALGTVNAGHLLGYGNDRVTHGVQDRLSAIFERPVAAWLVEIMKVIEGQSIAAICMDRYKQSELGEAIDKTGIRAPLVWRGQGFRDGGEDCERFRRACFDGRVRSRPSLLLRSAFADAVCLRDPANNIKLAKARSNGRIDPAAAAVLAVAEGARQAGRGVKKASKAVWA